METRIHSVTLRSYDHYGHRVPPDDLSDVLKYIRPLVRQSTMMAFQGRSIVRGKQPRWLDAASDVRFVDVSGDDETVLSFEVPLLGEAAEIFYRQQEFWPTKPAANETGFDLLGTVMNDVSADAKNSDRFDLQLLARIAGFGKACERPFETITVGGSRNNVITYPPELARKARRLQSETPNPQMVRVVGRLDMIRISNDTFALRLDDEQEVRGVITQGTAMDTAPLLDQRVVVIGTAIYRPSGHLLRVDAENILPGEHESPFWSRIPAPRRDAPTDELLRRRPDRKGGAAAVFGHWPGDESESELLAALKELG